MERSAGTDSNDNSGGGVIVLAAPDEVEKKRPRCPQCGSNHIVSKGLSWCCADCGRWFLKIISKTRFPTIDKKSWFYQNCKRQRKNNAKICQVCPFRQGIEAQE